MKRRGRLSAGTIIMLLLTAAVVAVFLATPYWKAKYFSKSRKEKED